ncbi:MULTISPECIES: hypothetical protein [Methylocaldum]|jgi:hypothetical protein|uniref:hypothetical protein n=1 Tax=unclassified Methylocaldum TaxID=2622260 RepID=UPI00098AD93C|nr:MULTISPECIES: hypothetical protein [unclassified Methylocaldum]MBP1152104.1 hypothetical protein [Methylocaldum sp. RMAD-M]MDV3241712.1 hypothetical protein [Methylocaldum sp.]MVF20554.1 hypothetical protein [Methylocaldum sp. BRCS4]
MSTEKQVETEEPTRFAFSHKEIAEVLIKKQGIHEGIWSLYMEFGLSAANVGQSESNLLPAAIVPVVKIGIQKAEKLTSIAVDASEINPAPKKSKRTRHSTPE